MGVRCAEKQKREHHKALCAWSRTAAGSNAEKARAGTERAEVRRLHKMTRKRGQPNDG